MNEYQQITYVVGALAGVLFVCDLYLFTHQRNSPFTPRTALSHTLYLLSCLALYALIGWLVTLPLPTTDELVRLFIPGQTTHTTIGAVTYICFVLTLITSFYIGGLIDYLVHRWFSHAQRFWWTHEYHHVPSIVMLAMPGIAVRPFSFFLTIPTIVVSLFVYSTGFELFNLPVEWYGAYYYVLGVHACILIFSHSLCARSIPIINGLLRPFGITTPQEHILHHTVQLSGNFANLTTVWDRVFGTYLNPAKYDLANLRLGVAYSQDFVGAITFNMLHVPARYVHAWGANIYTNMSPQNIDELYTKTH